ncbi:MAG: SufE family protein [Rhizobiales bacterium]|nr:SufE family protein [Hyphomicrobiales bacterium]
MQLETLKSDFELLDDWEDRYRHVIELGKELPPLDEAARTSANKVRGCASQVWLVPHVSGPPSDPVMTFSGDSDALIVKGLVAIAFMIYSGRRARDIVATDAAAILRELGLNDHLTPQRSNGFAALIERIKAEARAVLQESSATGIAGR